MVDYQVLHDSLSQPRFVDNGDGTVTDKQTGLMWLFRMSGPFPMAKGTDISEAMLSMESLRRCCRGSTLLITPAFRHPRIE